MTTKRILIIGGSRFSGKQLMLKLAAEGHQITVINRGKVALSYPPNVTHIAADRLEQEKFLSILDDKEFDWVFDFIAWQGQETKVLINHFKGKIERFVHISTGNYYNLEDPDSFLTQPLFEDTPMGPITEMTDAYSKGKRLIEQDLWKAYHDFRYPMTIIRPTFIYGPDNYFEREAYFFRRKLQNRPIFLLAPGNGYNDFIHAEDLADLCILAVKHDIAIGQAYNATCGEVISGEQMVALVDSWMPNTPKSTMYHYSPDDLKAIDWPDNKQLYPFTPEGLMVFSTRKAVTELGFKPRRLQIGLRETFDWYRSKTKDLPESEDVWKWEIQLENFLKEKKKEKP